MPSNPLTDLLPARWRRPVYAFLSLVVLVYSIEQATGGDWKATIGALIPALGLGMAHANTPKVKRNQKGAADVSLGLLLVAVIGIVLLLFRVHFN